MPRSSTFVLFALVGALVLTGCAADEPAPTTASDSATETPAPTAPSDSATEAPATPSTAAVPTDCATVVDAATYAATFGETPRNDPALDYPDGLGAVAPTSPPAGASTDETITSGIELRCIWRDPGADISFLLLEAGRVTPEAAQARLEQLAAEGYTCEDQLGGRQCQLVRPNEQYPVDEADTQFVRDDVLIRVQQANVPTTGLMAAVVARIWG